MDQQQLPSADGARPPHEEFLGRMHHELRTPLNAVIGFAKVLEANRAGNQRPEDIQMLQRVRAGGEQLLRVVENVLVHTELAQGRVTLAQGEVDVAALTSAVAERYRGIAAAKGLRLVCLAPSTAPAVKLDARRFEQVLQHLLDNAVKFTPSGTIRVLLVADAATNVPSRISVSDTGIGIPESRLGSIFDPYTQVDTSLARAFDGPGLGLPLARRLCHAMGCQLVAESQPGKGSRFTVVLPKPL